MAKDDAVYTALVNEGIPNILAIQLSNALSPYLDAGSASGVTSTRPTSPVEGFPYFDVTLGKPVWWDGAEWVDSLGAPA